MKVEPSACDSQPPRGGRCTLSFVPSLSAATLCSCGIACRATYWLGHCPCQPARNLPLTWIGTGLHTGLPRATAIVAVIRNNLFPSLCCVSVSATELLCSGCLRLSSSACCLLLNTHEGATAASTCARLQRTVNSCPIAYRSAPVQCCKPASTRRLLN